MRLALVEVDAPAPIGPVLVVSDGRSLLALDFGAPDDRLLPLLRARFGPAVALEPDDDPHGFGAAVAAYLAGAVDVLRDIPIDAGGTPFQRSIWAILRRIPAGETRSYGAVAREIGQPGAARAVGLANGANPVNLAVPCHRVIGSAGALTGYGGGVERKRWLLDHERIAAGRQGELRLA